MTTTTYRQIGEALGVNPGTALRWHRKGMPLEVEAAKAWRAKHAGARVKPATTTTKAAAGDGGTFSDWRTRRERAAALQAELDLREQAGRLLDVEEVRQILARHLTTARDIALSMGARLAPILAAEADQYKVHQLLNSEVHRMLMEISGADDDLAARQKADDAEG